MRRLALLTSATLLGLLAAVPGATPVGAAPPYTLEERAAAIASPALVFLDVELQGYLRVRATGALVDDEPVTVHSRCSGFIVSADGYVVTTTHCLQPSDTFLRGEAAEVVAAKLIVNGELSLEQRAAFVAQLTRTGDFTGTSATAPPSATVSGQLYVGSSDPGEAVIPGQVVEAQPTTEGDTTLVKLNANGLPVAQLTATTLSPESPVVLVAFGTAHPDAQPAIYTVRWQGERIVGRYGGGAPTRYQLADDLGGGSSHGGLVVDTDGSVVGMLTADVVQKNGSKRLVTDAAHILSLLASAGVTNQLTPTDQAYRAGLDAYFGGHYTEAIRTFDTVLAAQANNQPAQTYRRSAAERLAIEGEPGSTTAAWALIVAGVALALVVVMAVITVMRGRRLRAREQALARYEPYPPVSPGPMSGVPISTPPISTPPVSTPPAFGPPTSGAPTYPPPALPPTPPPASGGPVYAPTEAAVPVSSPSGPVVTGPDEWPAVTFWRSPHPGTSVPPPGPAPDLSTDPNPPPRP